MGSNQSLRPLAWASFHRAVTKPPSVGSCIAVTLPAEGGSEESHSSRRYAPVRMFKSTHRQVGDLGSYHALIITITQFDGLSIGSSFKPRCNPPQRDVDLRRSVSHKDCQRRHRTHRAVREKRRKLSLALQRRPLVCNPLEAFAGRACGRREVPSLRGLLWSLP